MGMLIVSRNRHIRGQRTDQAIAQQNSEEGSDQGCGYFLTYLFGGPSQRTHGDDHAQDSGHNTKSGQRVCRSAQSRDGLTCLLMMDFHVDLHHLIEIERFDSASDGSAHRVTHKIENVMIVQELWVFRKYGALGWLLDIAFDPNQAFLSRLVQKLVHHFQGFQIAIPGEPGTLKYPNEPADDFLQDVEGVCNENCARSCSADNQQLGWLQQHADVAVLHEEATYDRPKHQQDPDDDEHALVLRLRARRCCQ